MVLGLVSAATVCADANDAKEATASRAARVYVMSYPRIRQFWSLDSSLVLKCM